MNEEHLFIYIRGYDQNFKHWYYTRDGLCNAPFDIVAYDLLNTYSFNNAEKAKEELKREYPEYTFEFRNF